MGLSVAIKILFLGEVMGRPGRAAVADRLPKLRADWGLDFVVVSGEDASAGAGDDALAVHAGLVAGGDGGDCGGFYDRTLQVLRALRPTVAIGFAFAAQQLAKVPIDATDQRLDIVVTERGVAFAQHDASGLP